MKGLSKTCHYCKKNTHHVILSDDEKGRLVQCEECLKKTLQVDKTGKK